MTKANILADVSAEIDRAVATHGPMTSWHEAASVIREEFDEFWDNVKANPNKGFHIPKAIARHYMLPIGYLNAITTVDKKICAEARDYEIKLELVQLAAMCVRAIHDLA